MLSAEPSSASSLVSGAFDRGCLNLGFRHFKIVPVPNFPIGQPQVFGNDELIIIIFIFIRSGRLESSGFNELARFVERAGTVADLVFYPLVQLSKGLTESVGDKERIITKASGASSFSQ